MKKLLKYSGIVILLLMVIFFSLGIIMPSFEYQSKVSVNKPVEQSFKVFNNVFTLSDWVPGLKNIKWISGRQNKVGSKWEMTIEQKGKEYIMTETLTAFKENELFAFRVENDVLTNDVEVRFINNGTTSEIISSTHMEGKNIFWRSLFVFSRSYFRDQDQTAYDKLKGVIEKSN